MNSARRASVRALAKINLDLRVLDRRADGYHELRTVFQTISLADRLEIAFTPGRRSSIELDDAAAIPDNLVERAARMVLEAARVAGRVEMRLTKRIPMGAGLGGGSSDAAAVLLALPVLAGRALSLPALCRIAQELGSDVPFFLFGGTAAGIGRGTELFPLADAPPRPGVLVAPGIHVATAEAYRRLDRRLTSAGRENRILDSQSYIWDLRNGETARNDFESVVFEQHTSLAALKKRLIRAGAEVALMTGSGSAVYGLFRSAGVVSRVLDSFRGERSFRISLVNRARYRSLWWRALADHISGKLWPPQSRYLR